MFLSKVWYRGSVELGRGSEDEVVVAEEIDVSAWQLSSIPDKIASKNFNSFSFTFPFSFLLLLLLIVLRVIRSLEGFGNVRERRRIALEKNVDNKSSQAASTDSKSDCCSRLILASSCEGGRVQEKYEG